MLWVARWKRDVPLSLRHDPAIGSPNLKITCAMFWIVYCECEPPEWMRHDSTLQDENGYTCAEWWICCVRTEPPEYLRHDPILRDINDATCAMRWIGIVKCDVPEWMRHDPTL